MRRLMSAWVVAGVFLMSAGSLSANTKDDAKARRLVGVVRFVDPTSGFASIYDGTLRIYTVRVKDLRHLNGATVEAPRQVRVGDRLSIPINSVAY